MALVGYDISDASSDEEDAPAALIPGKTNSMDKNELVRDSLQPSASSGLRAIKSSSGKIQILAPSFDHLESSSDEDEERPKLKNVKPSNTGSGLRSLLPPVRGSSSSDSLMFAPKSTQQPQSGACELSPAIKSTASITSLIPESLKRKQAASSATLCKKKKEEEDVEVDPANFFSLAEEDGIEQMDNEVEEDIRLPTVNLTPAVAADPPVFNEVVHHPQPHHKQQKNAAGMSDLQLKKMISNKFGNESADRIELMDVNVNDHLSQSTEYLKSISVEKDTADKNAPQPNPTVRRKHHITYLAHQAKQRELALKEEWARNKATRNQSRAKYGF